MKFLFALVRFAAAVAILVAVLAQLLSSVNAPTFRFFNFFGYFTIQSNLLIMVTFVLGAVWALRDGPRPEWLVVARGATATYMATTGIVYNILLTNIPPSDFTVPWSNDIVHKWIPLIAVLEWIFFAKEQEENEGK
jgi:carbon starvation protein CstA